MKYSKNIFADNSKLIERIIEKSNKHRIKTITAGFSDIYGRFLGKKFDPDYFNKGVISKGSNACNYLLGCDMEMTPIPNMKLSSYDLGYGDFTFKPDLLSMRKINYINNDTQYLFFSDLITVDSKIPIEYCPRQMLRRSELKLEEMGIKVNAECDINFNGFYDKYKKNMSSLSSAVPLTDHSNLSNVFYSQSNEDLLSELMEKLRYSNIPVVGIHGDSGKGQFKIVLESRSPIEFSDNITLLKLISKKVADDKNLSFTFMAKYKSDEPGNSLNLKLSITDLDNKPIDTNIINSALAGVLNYKLDYLVFYAPNANSYKRLYEKDIYNNWNKIGNGNEVKGVNLIHKNNQHQISFVLPGADANPYLVLFSILESIRKGVQNKLKVDEIEKKVSHLNLPTSLLKAVKIFKNSPIARESLGDIYHDHYSMFYNYEFSAYNNQVSKWELDRYLYSI